MSKTTADALKDATVLEIAVELSRRKSSGIPELLRHAHADELVKELNARDLDLGNRLALACVLDKYLSDGPEPWVEPLCSRCGEGPAHVRSGGRRFCTEDCETEYWRVAELSTGLLRQWQRYLKVLPDGVLGPKTRAAFRAHVAAVEAADAFALVKPDDDSMFQL